MSGASAEEISSSDAVTLVSMDGARFVVEASAMMASNLFATMVDGEP